MRQYIRPALPVSRQPASSPLADPYPSGYMLNGGGVLPAYPVRAACSFLAASDLHKDGFALLRAVGQASGVFFNHSGQLDCFDWNQVGGRRVVWGVRTCVLGTHHACHCTPPTQGANPETEKDADFWGYQACTEQFMPFSRDGIHDMFWDQVGMFWGLRGFSLCL